MLKPCPECELQVSDKAITCPHCGHPLKNRSSRKQSRPYKRRRLPNGFGQISEIKNRNLRNPYRAMVTVGKDLNGKPICKSLKPQSYFRTYNDAYAALVEYNRNPYDLDEGITCQELYDKWSTKFFDTLKNSNQIRSYELSWRYCSSVYDLPVRDIRARHIKYCMEEGVADVYGKTQKANVRRQTEIKSMFNLMLDYAVEYEIVNINYARTFGLSKAAIKERLTVKHDHIPFTEEEISLLWKNVNIIDGVSILLIQCYSGWRPKELGLIKISDVDLDNWTFVGGIKTAAGTNRVVPIHPKIRDMVVTEYNKSISLGNGFLFSYTDGQAAKGYKLTYSRYVILFNKIKQELNLDERHRPHDGRKHFVTMAKKYNVDEYAIKYMVGHEIHDVTEKVYTDRTLGWLKKELEKIK